MTWFRAYLTMKQASAMRALSKRTRIPMAVFMREAVDHILAKYPETKS